MKIILSEMLNFDYKKRLDLNKLNEKIKNIDKYEDSEY